MSVENKIREFLQKTTVSEAYPGFGKSKEEESPTQGSSQKPQVNNLDKGAGADAAMKAGSATSLAAGSGAMEKSASSQGSSNTSPEQQDLGTDEPGKIASQKMSKTSKTPMGHGAGQARTTTASVDPRTVVNQSSSKGNVYQEDTELEFDEDEIISEEEFDALSEEEQAEYELVELDEEDFDDEVLTQEEFDALSEEEQAEYELVELDEEELDEDDLQEISQDLKNKYVATARADMINRAKNMSSTADARKIIKRNKFIKKATMKENALEEGQVKRENKAKKAAYYDKLGKKFFVRAARLGHEMGLNDKTQGNVQAAKGTNSSIRRKVGRLTSLRHQDNKGHDFFQKHYEMKEDSFQPDFSTIFSGDETLSEEFKEKAASLFEAVVTARVTEITEQIENEVAQNAADLVESYVEGIVEKVDDYLNFVVEKWLEENQLAVVDGLRNEVTEEFMDGLRNLFAEHYIEVPEERYDVVDEMSEKINELENSLNTSMTESIELMKELVSLKREAIISSVTEGLAQTEAEKFASLVEDVSFEDEQTFAEKLNVIKENYFPKSSTSQQTQLIDEDSSVLVESDSTVQKYAQAISRKTKF